jgi:effector-binding domain-containing protein
MNYRVDIITVTAQPIAVVRRQAKQAELSRIVPAACGEVWNFVKAAGIPAARHVAVYLDSVMNVEIGVEVTAPFEGDGNVVYSTLPAGSVVTTSHHGPYHLLGGAHDAVNQYCRQHGLRKAGTSWEIYGHWTDNPAQLRTDVFYLLADKGKCEA